MNSKKILIVDDDDDLSFIIAEMLEGCGYETAHAETAEEAFDILTGSKFHLILLDINLPDSTGFEICRRLREFSDVPVIFASARTSEDDRITGFDTGGDDYIPKPYSMKELLSRINALIRRVYGNAGISQKTGFGNVELDTLSHTVTKNGCPVSLSQREFDLLEYLCRNKNTAIPKDKLLSEVWGAFTEVEPSTLAVHIRWLREKLEDDPASPVFIKTIWRLGYMLEDKQ